MKTLGARLRDIIRDRITRFLDQPAPPTAVELVDGLVRMRIEEAERRRAAAEVALHAALSDLRDAKSEIKHLREVGRGFEQRALHAEERLHTIEAEHSARLLSIWATYGAQGGQFNRSITRSINRR